MNNYARYLSLIILLCLFPIIGNSAGEYKIPVIIHNSTEYVSLYEFIKALDVDNSFDVITQRGKLYRKSAVAVYQVGFPVAMVNGMLVKTDNPVTRRKGEVLFPVSMLGDIARALYPEFSVTRSNGDLVMAVRAPGETREKLVTVPEEGKDVREKIGFIIIDPGHGGKDPGAIGNRIMEKNITLTVSRHLAKYLKGKVPGITVKMTRNSDRFVELARRTEIANGMLGGNRNGLFVSVHVNASLSSKISGFETYYLSQNPTNEEARSTAAIENNVIIMENSASRKKYDDIEYLEALMLTTQIQKESSILAGEIQMKMNGKISEFKSRGVKTADFFVLRGSLMPAALVEIGYISNAREASYIKKDDYQRKIAEGIGRGVIGFIKKYDTMLKK